MPAIVNFNPDRHLQLGTVCLHAEVNAQVESFGGERCLWGYVSCIQLILKPKGYTTPLYCFEELGRSRVKVWGYDEARLISSGGNHRVAFADQENDRKLDLKTMIGPEYYEDYLRAYMITPRPWPEKLLGVIPGGVNPGGLRRFLDATWDQIKPVVSRAWMDWFWGLEDLEVKVLTEDGLLVSQHLL
jgi:hypothetical protein